MIKATNWCQSAVLVENAVCLFGCARGAFFKVGLIFTRGQYNYWNLWSNLNGRCLCNRGTFPCKDAAIVDASAYILKVVLVAAATSVHKRPALASSVIKIEARERILATTNVRRQLTEC